ARFSGPSALTCSAFSGFVSQPSTSVHAAQLITVSGLLAEIADSTARASAISRALWSYLKTSSPLAEQCSTSARPTNPLAPVISIFNFVLFVLLWLKIVLCFVVLAVCGVADLLDPRAVIAVPIDRFPQSGGPGFTRAPAELGFDKRRIDRIPPIVSESILDVLDQTARLPKSLQHRLHNLDVLPFIARADVVNRP